MSYEYYHKGNSVDIERTYGTISLHSVSEGRSNSVKLDNIADIEVLHGLLEQILVTTYAASAQQEAIDDEITGC